MKVVLVSSGQPSLNPRLVKEADALSGAGYEVTVLYAYWNTWGTRFDQSLLAAKKWKAIRVGGDPEQQRTLYLISTLIFKAARAINRLTNGKVLASFAITRAAWFLMRAAKKQKAAIYIGHNLGALMPVCIAAKKNNRPAVFDAEDFHRYETSNAPENLDVILKTRLEEKYFPFLSAFTTSSPDIAAAYQKLFPSLHPLVILNTFPKSPVVLNKDIYNRPLKLFWFSQTIGPNRGLDDAIAALKLLNPANFELHLLGHQAPQSVRFIEEIKAAGVNSCFHEVIPPDQLIVYLSQFDIGLALEPAFSINNDLALSNKVFSYMQGGLAVIASNTTAQKKFMQQVPEIGGVYQIGNSNMLANILLDLENNRDKVIACKKASLRLAHERYNWDTEALAYLNLIKNSLNQTS